MKKETLSDKIIYISGASVLDIKRKVVRIEHIKDAVKKLKETLVCGFCEKHPHYNGPCSLCHNAGIVINNIFGEALV